jgi:hypothetical protein
MAASPEEPARPAPVPARGVEPKRPRRERTIRSTEPATPRSVRPHVELDRESF